MGDKPFLHYVSLVYHILNKSLHFLLSLDNQQPCLIVFWVFFLSYETSRCALGEGMFIYELVILLEGYHGIPSSMLFRPFSLPIASMFFSLLKVKVPKKVKVLFNKFYLSE